MGLDKCPKCDGTNLIMDHKRIREIMDVDLSPLTVFPGGDDYKGYCPDCRSLIMMFLIELPGKDQIIEMCRKMIVGHDTEYDIVKRPQEG